MFIADRLKLKLDHLGCDNPTSSIKSCARDARKVVKHFSHMQVFAWPFASSTNSDFAAVGKTVHQHCCVVPVSTIPHENSIPHCEQWLMVHPILHQSGAKSAIIVYGKRGVTGTLRPRFLLLFVNRAICGRKFCGNPDKSRENIRHSL